MNLVPWKKKETDIVPANALASSKETSDIVITSKKGSMVEIRSKSIKIGGEVYLIDPYQLIRMIKQVTQTIGEYKGKDNPYAFYIIGSLRKGRSDMVSDLEHHFGIHWEIDQEGKSIFYI